MKAVFRTGVAMVLVNHHDRRAARRNPNARLRRRLE